MRHLNIPIFVPHLGCPNACVFCNQRKISGKDTFSLCGVREEIERVLATVREGDEVEIAFFGGSFTAIERSLMLSLLEIGREYIDQGRVCALRCSTRPDSIDEETLSELSSYGMKTVELGVQSISDEVLFASGRGHTREDIIRACDLVRASGMDLVCQMMLGLPKSTRESDLETARFIVDSGAVAARIYPTVVLRESVLHQMLLDGCYEALSLDEAILRGADALEALTDGGVYPLRIGLCASEGLSAGDAVAGAYHPALGELIRSELYYRKIKKIVRGSGREGAFRIGVSPLALSQAIGQHKSNLLRLAGELSLSRLEIVPRDGLREFEAILCE